MMWARSDSGSVVEVTGVDPAGRFHPDLKWEVCPDDTKIGDLWDGASFTKPAPAPTAGRIVSSEDFMALFTPAQTAALWSADPLLMRGAMKVMIQGSANLDSPDTSTLLTLAVTKGALSADEMTRILAGERPIAGEAP